MLSIHEILQTFLAQVGGGGILAQMGGGKKGGGSGEEMLHNYLFVIIENFPFP